MAGRQKVITLRQRLGLVLMLMTGIAVLILLVELPVRYFIRSMYRLFDWGFLLALSKPEVGVPALVAVAFLALVTTTVGVWLGVFDRKRNTGAILGLGYFVAGLFVYWLLTGGRGGLFREDMARLRLERFIVLGSEYPRVGTPFALVFIALVVGVFRRDRASAKQKERQKGKEGKSPPVREHFTRDARRSSPLSEKRAGPPADPVDAIRRVVVQLEQDADARGSETGAESYAHVSVPPGDEPWIQVYLEAETIVNIFFPFHDEPLGRMVASGVELLPGTKINALEMGTYCTLGCSRVPSARLAEFIHSLFSRLFGLGEDHPLDVSVRSL